MEGWKVCLAEARIATNKTALLKCSLETKTAIIKRLEVIGDQPWHESEVDEIRAALGELVELNAERLGRPDIRIPA